MKKSIIIRLFLGLILVLPTRIYAQTEKLWHVETTDGNEYQGYKLKEDSLSLTLKTTTIGEISIQKSQIKTMSVVSPDQLLKGGFMIPNAHSSRYFWSPNGYGLKKGEGYYQNTWVFLNQVSIGFTDHFTMGVGIVPLFLFGDIGVTPFWITPKVQFPIANGKTNIGAGVIYANAIGDNSNFGGAGIAYGVSTFGDRNKNLTVGLGYGFADGAWANAPIVTVSGMYRLGNRGYFMTENWFFSAGDVKIMILSVGGRYTAKALSFDYGLFRPFLFETDSGLGFVAFPWLGINVPFGNRIKK